MSLYSSYTDEQLVVSLISDDAAAFTELYERYWNRLLTYLIRAIGQQTDAEDLVQELFVSVWHRRHDLEIDGVIANYLFTSARYLAIRQIEKKSTYSHYLKLLAVKMANADLTAGNAESRIYVRELEGTLDQLIQQLPDKMREVFILSRKYHLSYKEIAERLSISEETVRKQIYKSLQFLRSQLGPLQASLLFWMTAHLR